MADTTFDKYKASGYYGAANIATLQEQLAQYAVDDDTLRKQAQAQYQPTYDSTKLSYQNQLGELMAGQSTQLRQINQSYDQSLGTLNSSLLKRGLGRSSLVGTMGVALENQRAQAIGDKTTEYLAQQNSVNSQIQQLDASYAQQIEARMNELRDSRQTAATQLQLQIAELQYNGYLAYMANQKSKSSSGGGGSSRSSSGSSSGAVLGPDVVDEPITSKPINFSAVGSAIASGVKAAQAAAKSTLSSGSLRHASRITGKK